MPIILFEMQKDITEEDCIQYAQTLTKSMIHPVPRQGCHSYIVLSKSGVIVQFHSQASPLDIRTTTLAKDTYGHLGPTTTYEGTMPNSTVTIWIMDALPGVGYLSTYRYTTAAKQDVTVIDMARWDILRSKTAGTAYLAILDSTQLHGTTLEVQTERNTISITPSLQSFRALCQSGFRQSYRRPYKA